MNMEQLAKGLTVTAIIGGIMRMSMAPAAAIWGVESAQELILGIVACLLMGTGIFGIYMFAASRLGTIGFLSVLLMSFSSTLTAALAWSSMLGITFETHDYVGLLQGVNSLTMLVGMLGFCSMSLITRAFPVWTVVLFLLFPVLSFVPVIQNWAVLAWGLSYIGFSYYAMAGQSGYHRPILNMAGGQER